MLALEEESDLEEKQEKHEAIEEKNLFTQLQRQHSFFFDFTAGT